LNKKGFTLIELLVVIVIIGILVAIALPNFIKIKDKAREAEVKQNLHSIQLAVERYATDSEGNYPYFLWGGDTRFNSGTHDGIGNLPWWNFAYGGDPEPLHPFDMFNMSIPNNGWCYERVSGLAELKDADLQQGFGDTLSYEGYLPKYPGNPFVNGKAKQQFSWEFWDTTNNGTAGLGGFDGTCMFNTGFHQDAPMLYKFVPPTGSGANYTALDLAGQFYYHPRFQDGVTNAGHLNRQKTAVTSAFEATTWAQYAFDPMAPNAPGFDEGDVSSLDVAAYDLTAFGSPRTKGQDLDASTGYPGAAFINAFRTGYLTQAQERNPWMAAGVAPYNVLKDYDERPFSDSIPDFYIIHLSSGIDKKIQNETDRSQ